MNRDMATLVSHLVLLLVIALCQQSVGFKITTHVHIGMEVLRSLRECEAENGLPCVYFELSSGERRAMRIGADIARALLENEETYLIGNYGPDAFPDIIAGQTIIHPGQINDNGKEREIVGTGDWCRHLLSLAKSPKELALVYGFLAHTAGDVFGHTYVNMFSGDHFSLADGDTEVEERHMLIEALIAKYTPEPGSGYYDYIYGDETLDLPLDFLYRAFFQNETARRHFRKSATSMHIILFENLLRAFDDSLHIKNLGPVKLDKDRAWKIFRGVEAEPTFLDYYQENKDKLKGAGLVQQIEIYVIQIVTAKYTGLLLQAEEAEKIAQVARAITEKLNAAGGKTLEKIRELTDEVNSVKGKIADKAFDEALKLLDRLNAVSRTLKFVEKTNKEISEVERKISRLIRKVNNLLHKNCQRACDALPTTLVKDYACKKAKKVTKFRDKLCKAIVGRIPCGIKCKRFKCRAKYCDKWGTKVCGKIAYIDVILVDAVCHKTVINAEKKLCQRVCDVEKAVIDSTNKALADARRLREDLLSRASNAGKAVDDAVTAAVQAAREATEWALKAQQRILATLC